MPTAYPWGALEPVSRAAERLARGARSGLRSSARAASQALTELLELPAEVVVKRAVLARVPALGQLIWVCHDRMALGMLAEPAMAAYLSARVLRRAEPLADPGEPLSPPLAGLLAALGVETARRMGLSTALLGAPPVGEEALLVEATLLLEGRPYWLSLYVVGGRSLGARAPELARLGPLELSIPLLIGSVALDRKELLALQVGAALMFGAGEGIASNGAGRGLLVAPQSERGIRVELRSDGRLVLGQLEEARLTVERDRTSDDEAETLSDVLLDTPVVVRVELGAVSMTAREWAELCAGDVIETAQRIAEPVVLRIAGREVGRGELVNVEGQVGVRIQKLYAEGGS